MQRRDYPVLQGGVLLMATLVMLVNLRVDLTYGMLNPRIRPLMSDERSRRRLPSPRRAGSLFGCSFAENRGAVVGCHHDGACSLLAVLADVVAPHSPDRAVPGPLPYAAGLGAGRHVAFPLGTDDLGRDMLSRLIYGARLSLLIGIAVVTLSLAAGVVLGLTAAFARRLVDDRNHAADGHRAGVPEPAAGDRHRRDSRSRTVQRDDRGRCGTLRSYTRLTRAAALSELARDYVTATRCVGAGTLRLMFNTVLPNCRHR